MGRRFSAELKLGCWNLAFLAVTVAPAFAENICPKYGNCVPETAFDCQDIDRSSFITRVCYSAEKSYLIIRLENTDYHYCDIDSGTVQSLMNADSMGRFYHTDIKDSGTDGRFSCVGKTVPTF